MKKKLLLFCITLFTSTIVVKGQNLVPNPGFEIQDTCPAVSQIYKAPPWTSATLGTPDLLNSTCSTQNFPGRTGIGCSGIYTYNTFANNREYMRAPLTSTLIAGQSYCVSFYVKRGNFRYACNKIGAYFSDSPVYQTTTGTLSLTPQVQYTLSTPITSTTNWTLISGNFIASGTEDNITIGSFSNDANTDTIVATSTNTSKVCYYRIDDISVVQCGVGLENSFISSKINLFPNPTKEHFSIQAPAHWLINFVSIYNNLGQEVVKFNMPENNEGLIKIENLKLSEGVYTVQLSTDEGMITKKMSIID
jgi:hypothetical protein